MTPRRDHQASLSRYRALAIRLRISKQSPYNLAEQGSESWNDRAHTAVSLFMSATAEFRRYPYRIADIGCGNQRLRAVLESAIGEDDFLYQGFDLLPQASTVTTMDLRQSVPVGDWDAVFTLGVLEYVPDIRSALSRLATVAPWLIMSHVVDDGGVYDKASVRRLGWARRPPTTAELERIVAQSGLAVVRRALIDDGRCAIRICKRTVDG